MDKKTTLLKNGRLFNAIREEKPIKDKLDHIQQFIDEGADVNAKDANDEDNTPLHIAVLERDTKLIEVLIKNGANIDAVNKNNETPYDIAALDQDLETRYVIQDLLQNIREVQYLDDDLEDCKIEKIQNIRMYQKRPGTSGLSGHLYEVNLLGVVLIRALNSTAIDDFYLGTNLNDIGAFDDIVLKYTTSEGVKFMFIQAKHKDMSTNEKVTILSLTKSNGDFNIKKYLDSYQKIKQKFQMKDDNEMFLGDFENADFIIYTSAKESFDKKKNANLSVTTNMLLDTAKDGHIFKYDYNDEDINKIINVITESRAKELGETLAKFVKTGKLTNVMSDSLIKTFHIYLARKLIKVHEDSNNEKFCMPEICNNIMYSDDKKDPLLAILKKAFYARLEALMGKRFIVKNDYESIKLTDCKLPPTFGIFHIDIKGSVSSIKHRIDVITPIILDLLDNASKNNYTVTLGEKDIGFEKKLHGRDIKLLVNTLTVDEGTELLKFITHVDSIPEVSKPLFLKLSSNFTDDMFKKYRFDICYDGLPRWTLDNPLLDSIMIKEFLNKLTFFTNQANENEVEDIIKLISEEKYYNICKIKGDIQFKLKSEAIYLNASHKIQRWWKLQGMAPFLDSSCDYFEKSTNDIIDNPLLTLLNQLSLFKLKQHNINFKTKVISTFTTSVLNVANKRLSIRTDNLTTTLMKLCQYLSKTNKDKNHCFVDMSYILKEINADVLIDELKESHLNTIVFFGVEKVDSTALQVLVDVINTNTKIILVSEDKVDLYKFVKCKDSSNKFGDLDIKTQKLIWDTKMLFQGEEILLSEIIDKQYLQVIDLKILNHIINNEFIEIGKPLWYPKYNAIKELYIERNVCRYIRFRIGELNDKIERDLISVHGNSINNLTAEIVKNRDIVIFSDKCEHFDVVCHRFNDNNVHWFTFSVNDNVWVKTKGSIGKLIRHVVRDNYYIPDKLSAPTTVLDIQDKIVLIGAEPGMGKSTLLSHLSIETKKALSSSWVIRINMIDCQNEFYKWKHSKNSLNKSGIIKFLCSVLDVHINSKDRTTSERIHSVLEARFVDKELIISFNDDNFTKGVPLLEMKVFQYLYNKGRIILLLDGIDEVMPEYMKEVRSMLKIIESMSFQKVWLASRTYAILYELEKIFNIFSYSLGFLTYNEQVTYLLKKWQRRHGDPNIGQNQLRKVINDYLSEICVGIYPYQINPFLQFTSIPLHLQMAAEIFIKTWREEDFSSNTNWLSGKLNLIWLYETFVDVKFYDIRFGEKQSYECYKNSDLKSVIDRERVIFLSYHKKCAMLAMFDENLIKSIMNKNDFKQIHEGLRKVRLSKEKTGIITSGPNNQVSFVHLNFAEYFAALFLLDKLKTDSWKTYEIFINYVMLNDKWKNIRRFFDNLLQIDTNYQVLEKRKPKLCNLILEQRMLDITPSYNCLYVAVEEKLSKITNILLNCIDTGLKKDTYIHYLEFLRRRCYLSCILCAAIDCHNLNVVDKLLSLVKKFDTKEVIRVIICPDIPMYNPLQIAITRYDKDKEPVRCLLKHVESTDDIVTILNLRLFHNERTILHNIAVRNGDFNIIVEYLEKLNNEQRFNVLKMTDAQRRTVLHLAAVRNNRDIFDIFQNLLQNDQYVDILDVRDMWNRTALNYFERHKLNNEELQILKAETAILNHSVGLYDEHFGMSLLEIKNNLQVGTLQK